MKWIHMLRQYKIYRNMAAGLALILAVTTLSLALVLYATFSGDMEAELGRMAASSMAQVAYVLDDLQSRTTALSRQLISDANVVASMFRNPVKPLELYRASRVMQFNRSVQSYVHCILIANGRAGRVYATCDLGRSDEQMLYHQISSSYIDRAASMMPFAIDASGQTGVREKVLGFVGYSELSSDNEDFGAVVIGVRPEYIGSLMSRVDGASGAFALLDSGGIALTHSDPSRVFQNLSSQNHLQRAMTADEPGYQIMDVEGRRCLVAYARVSRLGWTAVSVQPYAAVQARMMHSLLVTALASLILLALGLLVAMWSSARAYRPVAHTLASGGFIRGTRAGDEADYIKSQFARRAELERESMAAMPLVRDALLLQLITDWQSGVESSALHQIGIELCGPYYIVCILSLDEGDVDGGAGALMLSRPVELLKAEGIRADAVLVSRTDAALLMQLRSDRVPECLPLCFGQLQSEVLAAVKVSLSCAAGLMVTDADALPESYRLARARLAYRFFEGGNSLLLDERCMENHSAYLPFPQAKELRLRQAVQEGSGIAIRAALGPCVDHMRALTPEGAKLFAHQLVIGMLRKLPSLQADGEMQAQYMGALEAVRSCLLCDQVAAVLLGTLSAISESERSAAPPEAPDPQVSQMLQYIRERYTDPSISLSTVSGELNRSSAYLGRLFRTQVGRSFSESLGSYRTERAAELLRSTNEPLGAICERVGIANSNYFYTQFKKAYNCTPQAYREQMTSKRRSEP